MLIAVLKNKFIASFVVIFGTLSFPAYSVIIAVIAVYRGRRYAIVGSAHRYRVRVTPSIMSISRVRATDGDGCAVREVYRMLFSDRRTNITRNSPTTHVAIQTSTPVHSTTAGLACNKSTQIDDAFIGVAHFSATHD